MTFSNALTCSLLLLATLACGSEHSLAVDATVGMDAAATADAGLDASSDADVDAPADAGVPLCAIAEGRMSCDSSSPSELRMLLSAATYGDDAEFVAGDGDYVLVHRAEGPELLVHALYGGAAELPVGFKARRDFLVRISWSLRQLPTCTSTSPAHRRFFRRAISRQR